MQTQPHPDLPDLFSPLVISDPYPAYADLRNTGVAYDERNDTWLVARHRDVIEGLHHPSLYSSERGYEAFMSGRVGPAGSEGRATAIGLDRLFGSRVLIASDPPDHTLLRRIVSRPFTKKSIASWESRARALADDLVGELAVSIASGDADLVRGCGARRVRGVHPRDAAEVRDRGADRAVGGAVGEPERLVGQFSATSGRRGACRRGSGGPRPGRLPGSGPRAGASVRAAGGRRRGGR